MKARKRFGQNFLHDSNVIHKIIEAISPKSTDTIFEIGPGHGALTSMLDQATADLTVVEIDRDLAANISNFYPQINLVISDILKYDFGAWQPAQPARVVGNLPYNISTPLLFRLFTTLEKISDMHFMLQLEVVNRLAAAPASSDYGRLSIMSQYHCEIEKLFEVPPTAFIPAPKVTSAIVRLRPKKNPVKATDEKLFSEIVSAAFGQRRKTIRNSLKPFMSSEQLEKAGIDPGIRPEKVSLNQFIDAANLVSKTSSGLTT
ncbi:MAG: 16S rRNA (adenine(1518)-N(6)/adenine(1519)-N(6))-dimethyltransferase RsmA [Pseudomonadales bacterium]|jgi:16S rRNA (adenine1518-N6/adenine1519-N6)-dimethyltransferase|nr:16S rRNA (adenine(1518)-N(6)/adenine(1519)-N(6))-dimethyltransferase RsmA [Pseudomonadales bacterium]MDG1303549.1 16S rRNA (adenine(1518)-N(6)/adenine(1519)-N(6))-dimethyltransferase RsmA [Pseudomonadales bacterium]MDG1834320.1 16S rRNA (adenine(1518)-N(6)/adenine(1519)-N(6))-dimethyltransferase RsmA [Pseudomonadales bacterium]|tara:strand:+ start:279 stop:1058 length:780 start_codon:yes stop_codon:yes gene_type:complete